jgi:hypothetical protein
MIMTTKTDLKVKKPFVLSARVSDQIADNVSDITSSEGITVSDYLSTLILSDLKKRKIKISKKIC